MRASLLDKQTSVKRTEHMLIEKAYNEFHPPPSLFQYVEASAVEETESNSDDYLSAKKMAYIQKRMVCVLLLQRVMFLKKCIQCMGWNI
jgi:hypothetical protein